MKTASHFAIAHYPWNPDTGDGNYRNPIIHADYSDPDVIRQGNDYFMVSSSFNCTPGLPVLHSRDLVNWRIINHAIRNVPHPGYENVRPGCGVWAPSLRFYAGKFWIFFPMPDEGIYVTCTADPFGAWSEPWCLQEATGWIDPCPFWDDDGSAWLVHAYANSRAGKKERIHVRPMTPDCRRLLGEGREVIHTPHHAYLEGPKVHKLNGWYYILAPGGGVAQGWQVVFRSHELFGPYEEKVVLEQGATPVNGPHQGALVDSVNGEWWFLHFQDTGPFGRIVHLQPVRWEDHWPLMGVDHDGNGVGEPVAGWHKPANEFQCPAIIPQTGDEFADNKLGLQWQWQANHQADWASLEKRPGWLRLYACSAIFEDLSRAPGVLMQKFPARTFLVETLLEFGDDRSAISAGLLVLGSGEFAALKVISTGLGRKCVVQINNAIVYTVAIAGGPLRLRIAVDETALCVFSFAQGEGGFTPMGEITFQAKASGWIGAKVGIFCQSNRGESNAEYADFDYFRFSAAAN